MVICQIVGGTAFFMMIAFFMWAFAVHAAPGRPTFWNGSHPDDGTVLGLMALGLVSMFIGAFALFFVTEPDSGWRFACVVSIFVGLLGSILSGLLWYYEEHR